VGAGIFQDVRAACDVAIAQIEVLEPDASAAAQYAQPREVHAGLYHDVKARFAALGAIDSL
jgi:hypothetical protein